MDRAISDASDRLLDVNRNFKNVLFIGDRKASKALNMRLPRGKLDRITSCETIEDIPRHEQFDLVLSLLRLQSENDLPGAIIRLKHVLVPDGLFIAAMFGGETLSELRQVFYKTDEELLGGLAPHIFPFANYTQAAGLLSRAGLNQPVIDMDRFCVSYSKFGALISDLRDLGETNVLINRQNRVLTRNFSRRLTKNYFDLYSSEDGKFLCSFEILWLTGWSPHESQQKPLRRGSAEIKLEDALKNV